MSYPYTIIIKDHTCSRLLQYITLVGYTFCLREQLEQTMLQTCYFCNTKKEVTNTVKFWNEVTKYRDSSGLNPFKELARFAISVLVLPHSNAEVERIFSQMNIVKNKLRNRMGTKMVNSILGIRAGLKRSGKACFDCSVFTKQYL